MVNAKGRPQIKLIVYDFDGVLTDNRVLVSEDGTESVWCNRSDGWWMGRIKTDLGIEQCILSTEVNQVVSARARKLGLEAVQGQADKAVALRAMIAARGLSAGDVCYVGNEMNDFECLCMVGLALCPADSHPEILKTAHATIPVGGGAGIVRYIHDYLADNGGFTVKS